MRNHTTTRLALGCSFVAFAVVPLAAGRLSAAQRFPPPPAVSPLAASVIAPPSRVRGTDERRHLVYEIALLNTSARAQRMDRVEVFTGGGGVVHPIDCPDALRPDANDRPCWSPGLLVAGSRMPVEAKVKRVPCPGGRYLLKDKFLVAHRRK